MMADYRSAVPLLVESLASRCKHGDAHPDVIANRFNLAGAHLLLQNRTAAFPLIFAAVSAQQQAGLCSGLDDATLQGYVQQVHTLFKAGHAPYRVDQPVIMHGLTSEAEQRLNECTARVKDVVPATGQYVVRLNAGDLKAFKPENLRPQPEVGAGLTTCVGCHVAQPKSAFLGSQQKKPDGQGYCKTCVGTAAAVLDELDRKRAAQTVKLEVETLLAASQFSEAESVLQKSLSADPGSAPLLALQ